MVGEWSESKHKFSSTVGQKIIKISFNTLKSAVLALVISYIIKSLLTIRIMIFMSVSQIQLTQKSSQITLSDVFKNVKPWRMLWLIFHPVDILNSYSRVRDSVSDSAAHPWEGKGRGKMTRDSNKYCIGGMWAEIIKRRGRKCAPTARRQQWSGDTVFRPCYQRGRGCW